MRHRYSPWQGGSDSMLYVVQKCTFTAIARLFNFFKHYYYLVPTLRNFHQNTVLQTLLSVSLFRRTCECKHSEAFLALGSYSIIVFILNTTVSSTVQWQEEVSHLDNVQVWQVNNGHLLPARTLKGSTNVLRWKLAIDSTAASDLCALNEMNERD